MALGQNIKTFVAVTVVVVLVVGIWLFAASPLTWGFRHARNAEECSRVSLDDYSQDGKLYCRYKGKSFLVRQLRNP